LIFELKQIVTVKMLLFAPMILEKAVVDFMRLFGVLLSLIAVYMSFSIWRYVFTVNP